MNQKTAAWIGGTAAALAGAALFVQGRKAKAERDHPPLGRFIEVDGVRLHYVEEGSGPPLVLLHGLGSMVEDFVLSGLIREAAGRYRVIAFDRPGYGHSERPHRWHYSAAAQARLFRNAMLALGAHRPIVLGHSWGALVAAELALQFPGVPRSLVLASGLYFPTFRFDTALLAPPAIPLLGDLMSATISPILGRVTWRAALKTVFSPAPIPKHFSRFPAWMALRPGQLRANAEDALFTVSATLRILRRTRELNLPVVLVAGAGDRFVSMRAHSERLNKMLPSSRLLVSPHAGHMVHHTDPELMLAAIDAAAWPTMQLAQPSA
ncbi:MAG TPA: alpha/beta hydrolase [Burkholderiales bacterium]|nr:alpha/beta hydrolase [Burkholderiales bacterium]